MVSGRGTVDLAFLWICVLAVILSRVSAQTATPTPTPSPSPTACPPAQTLNNPAPALNDWFGNGAAISGGFAVVGAPYDDPGAFSDTGSAYVFNASTGSLVSTLNNPAPDYSDHFGASVAIAGNLVVVGAPNDTVGIYSNAGAVHVFNATTGIWQRTIANPAPAQNEYFGGSVGLSGNLVVIGAAGESPPGGTNVGIAYVFDATTGALVSTLANPEPTGMYFPPDSFGGYDEFGGSVSISGNFAAVGSWKDDPGGIFNAGRAYVFNATTGALVATLNRPPTVMQEDYFGQSVAISGNRVLVGVPYDNNNGVGFERGRAYVYNAATGALVSTINDPDESVVGQEFAKSVAIDGYLAVTGSRFSYYGGINSAGIVHAFDTESGALLQTFLNPAPETDDQMGISVGVSGGAVVAGAWYDNPGALDNAGSAYVFTCGLNPPFNGAANVAHTIPTQIPKLHPIPITITMQNTGNTNWSSAGAYDLEVVSDPCGLSPAPSLTLASGTVVQAGLNYTFSGILNGPASGGPCQIDFRMSEGANLFGSTFTRTLNVVDPVNNANILSSTIPATMFPGQSLWVEITVRNSGNTTWMPGGNYSLSVNSDTCAIVTSGPTMLGTALPSTNIMMVIYITAPGSPGSCSIQLQMTENPGPGVFGNILNKTINVINPTNAAKDWTAFE
ncbi:FG-GAP repeat protein [Candidatus Sumerlaeota bacterium]|nr:FG-GAP repeat protein [Candidatus Sumerlaeota bacterium]